MASITIRRLDDRLKTRLRMRAAEHGRSMEEEARSILRGVLEGEVLRSLADLALQLFGPESGIDLELPPAVTLGKPPKFE